MFRWFQSDLWFGRHTRVSIPTTVVPAIISLLQDRTGDEGEHRSPGHEQQSGKTRDYQATRAIAGE
jgi:hypothetical protein